MYGTTHIDPLLGTVLGGRYLLRECVVEGVRWRRYSAELEGRTLLVTTISGALLDDDAPYELGPSPLFSPVVAKASPVFSSPMTPRHRSMGTGASPHVLFSK